MQFISWLESITDKTKQRIYEKATTTGIPVRRGTRPLRVNKPYASDPGDFGRGIYYSTNWYHARSYATRDEDVAKSIIKFNNPLVLSDEEAYNLADKFGTINLPDEDWKLPYEQRIHKLLANAENMTRYMLKLGHDGLISVKKRTLEIVDYRPYDK